VIIFLLSYQELAVKRNVDIGEQLFQMAVIFKEVQPYGARQSFKV
jgi:hypothetical protein